MTDDEATGAFDNFELPEPPNLLGVIAVGKDLGLTDGMRTVVTSIELWSHEFVMHLRQVPSPLTRGGPHQVWTFTDDVGTAYEGVGGGGSGDDWSWLEYVATAPVPPPDATTLTVYSSWRTDHGVGKLPTFTPAVAPFEVQLPPR